MLTLIVLVLMNLEDGVLGADSPRVDDLYGAAREGVLLREGAVASGRGWRAVRRDPVLLA